jgi:hypothetical protein
MIFTPNIIFGFPVYNLNTVEASAIANLLPATVLMAITGKDHNVQAGLRSTQIHQSFDRGNQPLPSTTCA